MLEANIKLVNNDIKVLIKDAQALFQSATALTGEKAEEARMRAMRVLDTALLRAQELQATALVAGNFTIRVEIVDRIHIGFFGSGLGQHVHLLFVFTHQHGDFSPLFFLCRRDPELCMHIADAVFDTLITRFFHAMHFTVRLGNMDVIDH